MIGKRNQTAIGTLVERASGFAMLVPLPDGYKPACDESYAAIAEAVDVPPGTVASRISHCLTKLRAKFVGRNPPAARS